MDMQGQLDRIEKMRDDLSSASEEIDSFIYDVCKRYAEAKSLFHLGSMSSWKQVKDGIALECVYDNGGKIDEWDKNNITIPLIFFTDTESAFKELNQLALDKKQEDDALKVDEEKRELKRLSDKYSPET